MNEEEPKLRAWSEMFTQQRNQVRLESLKRILPDTVGDSPILDYLGRNTIDIVRRRTEEFPLLLGSYEIFRLGDKLRDEVRPLLIEKFGDASYLKKNSDIIWDESETQRGSMSQDHTTLNKIFWDKDSGILLGDHLGSLRINAVSYELVEEPFGAIEDWASRQILTEAEQRIKRLKQEIPEQRAFIDRKGLPKKEDKQPRATIQERVEEILIELEKDNVQGFVDDGVHPRIAKARVLGDTLRPKELTPGELEACKEELKRMERLLPELEAEYERLKPVIKQVVEDILDSTGLKHLMQMNRFALITQRT